MSQIDPKLVEQIARQVMAALSGKQTAAAPVPPAAKVQPPVGVCTGDYSKFPELTGKLGGTPLSVPPESPAFPASPESPVSEPIALSGIVTASQLQAAMDASPDRVAVLADDARLTPLANDLARQHPERIRRMGSQTASAGQSAALKADAPWLWWIDGYCPAVQELTSRLRDRLRPSGANRGPSALSDVVRSLAASIKRRQVVGGVLFVHNAARAMCLANRCPSIRAVLASCGEAVEQGIAELGANVLVVEYPHHGLRAMTAMVERMLQQAPKVPPAVERDLADLQRCG